MDEFKKLPTDVEQALAAHVELYRRDPEAAHMWDTAPIGKPGLVRTLLLRAKGRKSGEDRYVTLQYFRPNGLYVVVGTKGGTPNHPSWYLNLLDNPECYIQVGGFGSPAVARSAEGEEYDELWAAASEEQPRYKKYQARTSRKIPVIVLDIPQPDAD